tara:strand:+ start:624 stop:839 length:216 start_codon:yes stop_codon:yes gene_type:complete
MTIDQITSNTVIMNELEKVALEQVAQDIREKTGSGTTSKAVRILLMNGKDKTIIERFNQYVGAGIVAVATL